jgi:hypothetical protein
MVAATLALLALTFGLAASRVEVRRVQFIEEANAIGPTFLREEAASRASSDRGPNHDLARVGPTEARCGARG